MIRAMLRLLADFNELTVSDRAWLLFLADRQLDEAFVVELGLKRGDRVQLFPYEDDFEVEGVLDFGPANAPASDTIPVWYAQIDWDTFRRF